MAVLRVIDSGAGTTLQDRGRPGFQRYGVTEGGAMDRWALSEANMLLGNDANTAALEMIAVGGRFTIEDHAVMMACSGAEMDLSVDGVPIPWRSSFQVQPDQIVEIGYARESVYSYLQVSGGFKVAQVLGSASTHSRSSFGGFKGRALQAGDRLSVCAGSKDAMRLPEKLPKPDYLDKTIIRITWGTQAAVFSHEVKDALLQSEFRVSTQRDRMGARLDTDAGSLAAAGGLSGVSDAVLIGDIQVAGDGVATVLLADRQPTGGYPRIATVITADIDAISQMPGGRAFRFKLVTIDEAVEALRVQRQSLDALPGLLTNVTRHPDDIADLLSYNLIDGVVKAQ